MQNKLVNIDGTKTTEERPSEPRELFCKDFDLSCFEVPQAERCKHGTSAIIGHVRYFTLPVAAICPLCDRLQ
jgi:hypothetical protein